MTFTFIENMIHTSFGSSRNDAFWYYDVIHKLLCNYVSNYYAKRENMISDELKNTAIYQEKMWKLACNKMSCGEFHNEPVIINHTEIKPPWDFMELIDDKKPNFYWNNTKDSILKRTKQILSLAISEYKVFVDKLFPNMSNMLYHYQMLPFKLKCELYCRRKPCIEYFIECLDTFKYSNVEIKWNDAEDYDSIIFSNNVLKGIYDSIVQHRTESSRLLYPVQQSAVLEIWKFMPVFDKILEWFNDDLKNLYLSEN